MKIRFIKSYNLIFFMIALLSFCLVIFKLSPAVPVRAEGNDSISIKSSQVLNLINPEYDSSTGNYKIKSAQNYDYNSLIFKLKEPILVNENTIFEFSFYITNYDSSHSYYLGGKYEPPLGISNGQSWADSAGSYNTTANAIEYVQIIQPTYTTNYDLAINERLRVNLCSYQFGIKNEAYAKLFAVINGTDSVMSSQAIKLATDSISISDNNFYVFKSVEDFIVDDGLEIEVQTTRLNFYNKNINNSFYSANIKHFIDGEIISNKTILEIFEEATTQVEKYNNSNYVGYENEYFVAWEISADDVILNGDDINIYSTWENRANYNVVLDFREGINTLFSFTITCDFENNIISENSLFDIFELAKDEVENYVENFNQDKTYDGAIKKHFKSFDTKPEDIVLNKENERIIVQINFELEEVVITSKIFEISFFGMYNEQLCQTFYVTLYSNGQIDNTAVTYENMFNIATENAKVLDNTTQHGNYYNYYFKNFSITAEELEDEILNSESGKSININANYEFLLRDNKVKIYDKDLNSFEEIVVVSGTLFNELNLVPKDIYLYNFVSYKSFVWDPVINKPNNVHWVSENYMIVNDLNIFPEYEYIGVEVSIITKRVNDYFGGNNDYHSFEPKALFHKTIEKGEIISMPLPIYYYNFTPKFWTLEFDEINDYETGWANRIDDLSLKSYTISEDYDLNKLTIYLVYRYENGGIINPVPPSDIGGIENDVNSDFNNEQNTIVVGDNTIKLPFNKYWLLLIPGAVLVIAICIVVIILIKRRKKWKNN